MKSYKIKIKTKTKTSPYILDVRKHKSLIFKILNVLRVKADVR